MSRRQVKGKSLNWAVFNIETGFRLTEYTTRVGANHSGMSILKDQPELRLKIAIKQRDFEKVSYESLSHLDGKRCG